MCRATRACSSSRTPRHQHRADARGQGRHRPNAIDLAQLLSVTTPKVAILAGVETVNSKMPATLDAWPPCARWLERGKLQGGIPDGPLAPTTCHQRARPPRRRRSPPRSLGTPTSCSAPDLEAGNMSASSSSTLAGAEAAGIVLGRRPRRAYGRADTVRSRLASCAKVR